MRRRSQSGLTLVETLVYVGLSAIVLGVLTYALRNMNRGFLRDSQTVKMQQGAREALSIMSREFRNAGLKRAFYRNGSGATVDSLEPKASLLPGDSSSFGYVDGSRYDCATVRMLRIDAAGAPQGVDTVTYQVDPAREMLQRRINGGSFQDFCANVDALQFQYGVYAVKADVFNEKPPVAANWSSSGGVTVAYSATRQALQTTATTSGVIRNDAFVFPISGGRTYFLDFLGSADAEFFDHRGLMEVQILTASGTVLRTEPFLPGRSLALRHIELTAPTAPACRLAIRMSTQGSASVRIASLRFAQADLGAYQWKDAPTLAEKKTVRAIRIMLMAKTPGQVAPLKTGSYTIGNAVVTVADKFARLYYEEEVPVPNNGLF